MNEQKTMWRLDIAIKIGHYNDPSFASPRKAAPGNNRLSPRAITRAMQYLFAGRYDQCTLSREHQQYELTLPL